MSESKQPKIVVGVDGSSESKEALRWAHRQAALTGARLVAVISWHFPSVGYGAMVPLPDNLDLAGTAGKALDQTIAEVLGSEPTEAGVTVETLVVEGPPALALLEQARDAELLVVGSRGHGEFVGMLIGSVSEHVVSNAGCPVVVVRHPKAK